MSPKVRLLALGALVSALALGIGMVVLGRSQGSSQAATPKIHPLYPHKRHHARAHKPVVVQRARAPRKRHLSPAVVDGMPAALARALSSHEVVVVALHAPNSHVDDLALAEARAGAADAGAGFVAIDVLNERQSQPLTDLLATAPNAGDRVLDDPAVLVFQQPKTLFVRLNGFADRDTVAQAVQNAVPLNASKPQPSAGDTWAQAANGACLQMRSQLLQLVVTPGATTDYTDVVNKVLTIASSAVTTLHTLPAPAGKQTQVDAMLAAYDRMLRSGRQALAAAKGGDKAAVKRELRVVDASGKRADSIAYALGATECGSKS